MEIRWHGLACFTIKGDDARVVIDPYDRKHAGLKCPKLEADVVLANEKSPHYGAVAEIAGTFKIFNWPGEYEAKGVNMAAIPAYDRPRGATDGGSNDQNVLFYTLEVDGFKICHLSNIGHKLTNEMSEMIGDVDILLVPIGGNGVSLDVEKAHEVIEQLEPRIVIPMYYNIPGCAVKLGALNDFLKEVGLTNVPQEKVFKMKKRSDLPVDKTEFFILEPTLN